MIILRNCAKYKFVKERKSKMVKLLFLMMLLIPSIAKANPACAVCTVAMGAFLGISRALGISDNATGVWIGGLLLMTYYFTIKFVEYKKWTFKFYHIFWGLMTLCLVPVMYNFVQYKFDTFFGIDAFLISMICGAFAFWLSQFIYQIMKNANGRHAHFPFEKVVMAVIFLLITSIIFNYLQ